MSCLCITDIDAIEEDCDLFRVASTYTYVGQNAQRTFLSDVNSDGIFEQIIYTLYWSGLNIFTTQYSYHSRLLTDSQWCTRSSDAHFIHHHTLTGCCRVAFNLVSLNAYAFGSGMLQGSNTQYTNQNLFSKNRKQGIAVVGEVLKLQNTALLKCWFVHILN